MIPKTHESNCYHHFHLFFDGIVPSQIIFLSYFLNPWSGIFVFCLLLFPQNEGKIYKLRQLSFSQFIYIFFLAESHLCLLLQNTFFCKSKQRWLRAQKKYKLRQTKLSWFVYFSFVLREWEETKTKYSATRTLEPQS